MALGREARVAAVAVSGLLGAASLLLFGYFLMKGPLPVLWLGLEGPALLAFDAALSLLFFAQHSLMIRRSFRRRLGRVLPEAWHGVLYTLASSVALLAVVLLWQESAHSLGSARGAFRVGLRALFLLCFPGFLWGLRVLRSVDLFGHDPLLGREEEAPSDSPPRLVIRGPYRWVRHPMYLLVLVMIWTQPDLTLDRLLFNLLWSGWVVLGSVLEERDLVDALGEDYRAYQRKVPMLLPLKGRLRG
jgi:protein-S-isoprenylcysteine O-methyltransferase Ste14